MTVEEMISKQREDKLISLGYCERVYSNTGLPDGKEFPLYDMKMQRYYKEVPLSVTDEEFERILAIGEITPKVSGLLPIVLNWTGISIYVVGAIAGMIIASSAGRYGDFSFTVLLAWWVSSFLGGIGFQWMGAVLKALHTKK